MTDKEVWLDIAQRCDQATVDYDNNAEIPCDNNIYSYGVCGVLFDFFRTKKITLEQWKSLHATMTDWLLRHRAHYPYAFPLTLEGARMRAALCRKFAIDCEEKENSSQSIDSATTPE